MFSKSIMNNHEINFMDVLEPPIPVRGTHSFIIDLFFPCLKEDYLFN